MCIFAPYIMHAHQNGMKKLDVYILKSFLGLFIFTFVICMFILLMQFLWMHINDLVGKGVEISVLAEFFLYACISVVPLSLPLAILLASLMTFGNLGEYFELTAMKAAGIPLFRIMRPLAIAISFVCVGAFFFSNYVLPVGQTKLWTLIFSLRQKSPEFDIPVGEFYDGINGYQLYVREKDNERKLLKNLMIYDFSEGFDNATVMLADSGKVFFTEDKKYLILQLYKGESFENLKRETGVSPTNIPYRRETFETKKLLIEFDSEFNRYDDNLLKDQHVSKDIVQLQQSIDSVTELKIRRAEEQGIEYIAHNYFGRERTAGMVMQPTSADDKQKYDPLKEYQNLSSVKKYKALKSARDETKRKLDKVKYNRLMLNDHIMYIHRHEIEWHRKFTLSFACLIFFFIGAPLGAIVRKGGLGAPVVISVIMFIVYYMIDNTGYKMAREGLWTAFEGMWLSSAVLLPIGIFLTYKAATDSALFNPEAWMKLLRNNKIKRILKQKY